MRESERSDEDDDLDDHPPRVRPVRMVLASVFGILAMLGAVTSWFVMYPSHPAPEPQGSAAAVGQAILPVVALILFVIFGLVVTVSAITLARALREARNAGRLG